MFERELAATAAAMVAPGKGILAIDESSGTIKKRFDLIGVESNEENRRAYRDLLITPDGLAQYISGMILYDETIRQATKTGVPFAEAMKKSGILVGIKVDTGAKTLAGAAGEQVTEGLDGLRERLAEYKKLGAVFAKWRAVITIGKDMPSQYCIDANVHALARYAALCQEAGIVPIVEPEVLMDGEHSTHDIDACDEVTRWVLRTTFNELADANVKLEGIVLKPNMVIAGQKSAKQASAAEVAEKTVKCLKATVPGAVPGIAFLSGGQSDEAATEHLSLINAHGHLPWNVTFSYGRALQAAALKAWGGKTENVAAGQRAFSHRAKMNSMASFGKWQKASEKAA